MSSQLTRQIELQQQLQDLWRRDFPLSNAMGIQVTQFAEHTLTTCTPLQANTNTHGTAFAGSLYSAQALTAWGVLYLELASREIDASIIHANAQIEFSQPLAAEIVARCTLADADARMVALQDKGKLRLSLTTTVTATQADIVSNFTGDYVIRLNR
ncbi:MAG: YiiD C-terminal domain-containing protein [Pseudomonadota bacterium]